MAPQIRRPFTEQETLRIMDLVEKHGPKWSVIKAMDAGGEIGLLCRSRRHLAEHDHRHKHPRRPVRREHQGESPQHEVQSLVVWPSYNATLPTLMFDRARERLEGGWRYVPLNRDLLNKLQSNGIHYVRNASKGHQVGH